MATLWGGSGRFAELSQWARHLLDVRDTLGGDAAAGASFVAATAGQLSGDFAAMARHSADAITASTGDTWIAAQAQAQQALFWAPTDPVRTHDAAQQARRIAAVVGAPNVGRMATQFESAGLFFRRDVEGAMALFAERAPTDPGFQNANWAVLHALAGDLATAESIDVGHTGTTAFALHMIAVAQV